MMHQCHIVKQPYNLRPVRTSTSMYTEVVSILSTLCTHFVQTGLKSIVSESIRLTYGRHIEVNPHEYLVVDVFFVFVVVFQKKKKKYIYI